MYSQGWNSTTDIAISDSKPNNLEKTNLFTWHCLIEIIFYIGILIFLQYYDYCPKWSSGVDENDATYQEAKLFTETQVAKVKNTPFLSFPAGF